MTTTNSQILSCKNKNCADVDVFLDAKYHDDGLCKKCQLRLVEISLEDFIQKKEYILKTIQNDTFVYIKFTKDEEGRILGERIF